MPKSGIVAFAFGIPDTLRSNELIASVASAKAREIGAPVFTQKDYVSLPADIETAYVQEEPGKPAPTLRIARQAVVWAQQNHIDQLWVVCAEPHLRRCARDLDIAVTEAGALITIAYCRQIRAYRDEDWFCPDSTQERTRSREAWQKRERILCLIPAFLYKRIAG